MQKNKLGNTGIEVTQLCFGALPMGPLQKNMSISESAELVLYAIEKGVDFIDTAQFYKTYEPIGIALKKTDKRPVIATKSFASAYSDMEDAINEALQSMGIDYIDIFHIHAPRSGSEVFKQRKEALKCLCDYKEKGIIKSVGISTHTIDCTGYSAGVSEIDVVFPVINYKGLGIIDGSKDGMIKAIDKCVEKGKGIYLMKVLGGGSMIEDYYSAMEFACSIKGVSSIAMGMVSKSEIDFNVDYFTLPVNQVKKKHSIIKMNKLFQILEAVCSSCKACISACPNDAISLVNEKPRINSDKCVRCGYCVGVCPQFAIRMV